MTRAADLANGKLTHLDIDGGTDINANIADADLLIMDDGAGGTNRKVAASRLKTYISTALDDITTGDAATTLATSAGNITIDAQGSDTDIIFKGTDDSSDITMLTLDGSDAGAATFNDKIIMGSGKELQFVDTNESIQSDGSKMIVKSGGTTFNLPTSDGSNGQALVTNGSGTLSFAAAGASLANDANNRVTTATGSGGLNGESGLTYDGSTLTVNRGSDGTVVSFTRSGSQQGYIHIYVGGVTYATSSDYRLKENVSDMTDATDRIKQLKPKRFNFIADKTNTVVDGFLAHEVSDIVPEAIIGEKDATNEDGSINPQGIDQSKLVPLLVKTIQELEARIAVLESK